MSKEIIVVGSVSVDYTIKAKEMPQVGVTAVADSYYSNIGGKGANQACASLFLDGNVCFIGAVGKDDNGAKIKEFIKKQGLKAYLKDSDESTGVAFIILDEKGDNRILIVQGANVDVKCEDIDKYDDLFTPGKILLTQLENSVETVQHTIKKAHDRDMTVVLNPAPAKELDGSYFKYVDFLVPNEHELEILAGTKDIEEGARILLSKGCKNVIVTLGENGSILVNSEGICRIKPHKVHAIDTTAAGDSYLGAFVTKLSQGCSIIDAMEFASLASSYTVTKRGAIIALPYISDLE